MTRQARAKQFQPFDAMKGLKAALKKIEDEHSEVLKTEISEDRLSEIDDALKKVEIGKTVSVCFYKDLHYFTVEGRTEKVDFTRKFFVVGGEKIFFDDIYDITIR